MSTFSKWLYLIALIVWVGEMVFFSFVVAPAIFRVFPPADAGRAVGAIFPTYYGIGYACGLILCVGSVVFWRTGAGRGAWMVNTCLAAVMLAATLYAGRIVLPRATLLRPQVVEPEVTPAAREEFQRLHRWAVNLNSLILSCGLAMSLITAARLRP